MIVFIAGKYTTGDVHKNILAAKAYTEILWEEGFEVYCPHLNTTFTNNDKVDYERYMRLSFALLGRCDAIYMLPNWEESPGANRELQEANKLNIPVAFCVKDLKLIRDKFYTESAIKAVRFYDDLYAKKRQEIIRNHLKGVR